MTNGRYQGAAAAPKRSPRRFLAGQDERTEAAGAAENLVAATTRPSAITPGSCGLTTPSPPAEKATARQDQAGKSRTGDGAGDLSI
jgi:hypothetical protein